MALFVLPHLTMQVRSVLGEISVKLQGFLIDEALTLPPMTTKAITPFVDHPSQWNTSGSVTSSENFRETASLLISHSMSTIIEMKVTVRLFNTTESPYTIRKQTQIAEFSIVTQEQSKFSEPVDRAILSLIREGDPRLTAYVNEQLRTNKTEQQIITFWFPTAENPGKREDHIPIQTRILKELVKLKEKKLSTTDNAESREKFLERFNCTDTS